MDSILKNVGGVYCSLFASSVLEIFKGAYDTMSKDDRGRLSKLIPTWKKPPGNKPPLFPPQILMDLERFVMSRDQMLTAPKFMVSLFALLSTIACPFWQREKKKEYQKKEVRYGRFVNVGRAHSRGVLHGGSLSRNVPQRIMIHSGPIVLMPFICHFRNSFLSPLWGDGGRGSTCVLTILNESSRLSPFLPPHSPYRCLFRI